MDSEIAIIQNKIIVLRNQQVMIDRDIAELYGVETKRLNEQVKRNIERFPEEFCFQLNTLEFENWKSQFATSNSDKMGLRKIPYAFTEQGVAMLSAVLKTETAVRHTELQCAIPIASSKLHHNNPRSFFDNRQ